MSSPINRFSHLKGVWKNILDAETPTKNLNLGKPLNINNSGEYSFHEIDFSPGSNRISSFYLNLGIFCSDNTELKNLKTICEGIVIPTEPEYIKFLQEKKRQEIVDLAKASAGSQGLKEFTLAHLLLASALKDSEFVQLIYKNGLGPESISHLLEVPIVDLKEGIEAKPDDISRWIISHSEESNISIFDAICHFLCEVYSIAEGGNQIESKMIIDSIKDPYAESSILYINKVPKNTRD